MTNELECNGQGISSPLPRHRWLPVDTLEPGMVLAKKVVGGSRGRATLMLGEGSLLTAGTIGQLTSRAVEVVAILDEHPPAADEYFSLCQAYETRLKMIFCRADGEPPANECQFLFDALLAVGPNR